MFHPVCSVGLEVADKWKMCQLVAKVLKDNKSQEWGKVRERKEEKSRWAGLATAEPINTK